MTEPKKLTRKERAFALARAIVPILNNANFDADIAGVVDCRFGRAREITGKIGGKAYKITPKSYFFTEAGPYIDFFVRSSNSEFDRYAQKDTRERCFLRTRLIKNACGAGYDFNPSPAEVYSYSYTGTHLCFFCLEWNPPAHKRKQTHALNREKLIIEFAALWKIDTDCTRYIMEFLYNA